MKSAQCLLFVLAFVAQPGLAQAGPGRCTMREAHVESGRLTEKMKPYVECLAKADQRYGYNTGPFAVHQCADLRKTVAESFSNSERPQANQFLDELDSQFAWLMYCATDVGSELPADIQIKAGWPQAHRNTNAPNH